MVFQEIDNCMHDDVDWGDFYGKGDVLRCDGECECGIMIREVFVPAIREYYDKDMNKIGEDDIQI